MKNYTITVNGVAYEVTVEEGAGGAPAARGGQAPGGDDRGGAPGRGAGPAGRQRPPHRPHEAGGLGECLSGFPAELGQELPMNRRGLTQC